MGELNGKLEPEAETGPTSLSEAALLSAAISLKRIADTLTTNGVGNLEGPLNNLAWEVGQTFGRAFEIGSRHHG